ncbi:hypothetical protein E2C01_032216 [Portunus trituberculatus]|uniref:Uncharacterized protein n=1 Tax=Portunus trituberculatus TaxID=210409 RepID=A0A5B7F277_PORTR|nr:hypothetical protein [Portunus trituberculatus]
MQDHPWPCLHQLRTRPNHPEPLHSPGCLPDTERPSSGWEKACYVIHSFDIFLFTSPPTSPCHSSQQCGYTHMGPLN